MHLRVGLERDQRGLVAAPVRLQRDRHLGRRLDPVDPGHTGDLPQVLSRQPLAEDDLRVLALHVAVLVLDQQRRAVDHHPEGEDQDQGEDDADHGGDGAARVAADRPQRHPPAHRQPPQRRDEALEQAHPPGPGGREAAHRLGWRDARRDRRRRRRRQAARTQAEPHPEQDRQRPHFDHGQRDRELFGVEAGPDAGEAEAGDAAEDAAQQARGDAEGEVVEDERAAPVAAGAQHPDDRPLRGDQPAHQHPGRQRRRGEEEQREEDRELLEAGHVLLQGAVGGLLLPGQDVCGAEPLGGAGEAPGERCVGLPVAVVDRDLVGRAAAGQRAGEPLGGEDDAEVLGRREDFLAAARRPEVLGRGDDAAHLHPPRASRRADDRDAVSRRQVERVRHVLLDQYAARISRPQVGPLLDREPVDRGRAARRHPDHPAEELVPPDPDRHVRLRPRLHSLNPGRAARHGGDRARVPAGHREVSEAVLGEGAVVGALQVEEGVVGGAEQRHPEEDRQCDRRERGALATDVAARLRPQRLRHALTTPAPRPAPASRCAGRRRSRRRAFATLGPPFARSRRCGSPAARFGSARG